MVYGVKDDKPQFRYPYFKDLYKVLLTVTSGSIVASVAFMQNMQQQANSTIWFRWGLAFLSISVILQLVLALVNAIASGFYWDSLVNEDRNAEENTKFWGKVGVIMLGLSILLTTLGVGLMLMFTNGNIGKISV